MDGNRFPPEVPGFIGGKTFLEIFQTAPKIVEFVDSLWEEDKTTGLFKTFFVYIKNQLSIPDLRAAHAERCCEYVKHETQLPSYMMKYVASNKINIV